MPRTPSRAISVVAGRYEVGDLLGRGGMAEVRAGTDLRLRRPVAVKFLLPEIAARDDLRRRFEAEACAAASLSDPHAVAVYDTGEHDGHPYIVLERLPGETLADRIAAGPVDPAWARQIAVEVLGALAAAHARGLIHRDVKPGNILLTADGHAKIADFGIAKSVEGRRSELDLTGTGQLLGTPAYLAPEQLDGAPATAKSDIYALGVVLYEALAGRRPFPATTALATARAIATGDYQPLDEVRPGLDRDLVAAVERAMAIDPEQRFESADAMAAALTAAEAPTLVHTAPAMGATSVMAAPVVHDTVDVVRPPLRPVPWFRSRSTVALLGALLFIALLVAVLNRGSRAESNQPASATTPSTAVAPPSTAARTATTAASPTTVAVSGATASTAVTAGSASTGGGTVATAGGGGNGNANGKGKDDGKGKGKD